MVSFYSVFAIFGPSSYASSLNSCRFSSNALQILDISLLVVYKMDTQFGGTMGERMKSAYGAFCSRHNDALQLYKALLKSDVTFQEFIKVSKTSAKSALSIDTAGHILRLFVVCVFKIMWLGVGGTVGRASDSASGGGGFQSWPYRCYVTMGKLLSVSVTKNLVAAKRR